MATFRTLLLILLATITLPALPSNLLGGAEMPVSEPDWIPAPGRRTPIAAAASETGVGLVLWSDERLASFDPVLVASRVSSTGEALDPLGIHLGSLRPASLVWNGEAFAIVARRVDSSGHEITFVGIDGVSETARPIDLPAAYQLTAASQQGSAPRFLFVSHTHAGDRPEIRFAIVDGHGNVIARDVLPPPSPAGLSEPQWFAGSGDDDFLLLRLRRPADGFGTSRLAADVISRDGQIVSSRDQEFVHGLELDDAVVAGNGSGWVLAPTPSWRPSEPFTYYTLSPDGIIRGGPRTLPRTVHPPAMTPHLRLIDGEIVMTWSTTVDSHGKTISLAAVVGPDGVETTKEVLYEPGLRPPLLPLLIGDQLFAFYDSNSLRISETFEAQEAKLLAVTATRQREVAAAAGRNGFLVGWVEEGKGTFVRRISTAGAYQDQEPIPVDDQVRDTTISLVSNGDVYLVLIFTRPARIAIRRLDAMTGEWIDPEAVELQEGGDVLASDGDDALMVWSRRCGSASAMCVQTRRIPMSGPLLPGEVVTLHTVDRGITVNGLAVDSNGRDYLVAWAEWEECHSICPPPPTPVRALRVRRDGTAIDSMPVLLNAPEHFAYSPSTTWDGRAYVVVWDAWNDGQFALAGVRVTPEGAVLEGQDGSGTLIDAGEDEIDGRVVRFASGVALVMREMTSSYAGTSASLRVVAFGSHTPLTDIAQLPGADVRSGKAHATATFAAAAAGRTLLVAYERFDDSVGYVPRVLVRLYTAPPSRIRIAPHP